MCSTQWLPDSDSFALPSSFFYLQIPLRKPANMKTLSSALRNARLKVQASLTKLGHLGSQELKT